MDERSSVQLPQWIAMAAPIALAVLGGVVRQLRRDDCSLRRLCVGAVTAAFTGAVVQYGLADVAMPASFKAAAIGMSGWAGGDLLKVLAHRVCKAAETVGGK
ncbi:phage holin family protein [Oleidesulfovibrio sp.]|uniref:phage holin family protein n=1 Tax=Oleidesulfovibrio sp. TaxID=2909707 RepID=UPI003A842652